MIQSIKDYENWRDSQQDRPVPEDGPDERSIRFYSHDYPADTTLEYSRTGDRAELRLSFSSEDPDMGTEEMIYAGENGESMHELVADLHGELTAYLDAADSSSFVQQQGLSSDFGIHDENDYYAEYSRTALYAFESLLSKTEKEQGLTWQPIDAERTDWLYSGNSEEDKERGCIGHLRGDFGSSGNEFWTSWFDHQPALNVESFRQELQDTVDSLRKEGGLLQNFRSMNKQCHDGLQIDDSFGFKAESKNYQYCLRCLPQRGNYNFYLYAYDKNAQREHNQEQSHEQRTAKPKVKKNEMER